MSNYKAVDMEWLNPKLTEMANSIRAKTGGSASLVFPDGFTEAIDFISVGDGRGEIPDDYIKKLSTWNYTSAPTAGYFSLSSDTLVTKMNINIGYKPKVFYVRNFTQIKSNSSRLYVTDSLFVVDNNYDFGIIPINGNDVRTALTTGVKFNSNTGQYETTQSNGSNHILYPADTGVQGDPDGSTEMYFKANTNYYWIAWG